MWLVDVKPVFSLFKIGIYSSHLYEDHVIIDYPCDIKVPHIIRWNNFMHVNFLGTYFIQKKSHLKKRQSFHLIRHYPGFAANVVMGSGFIITEPNWCHYDHGLLLRYSFHQFSLMDILMWLCGKWYKSIFSPLFNAFHCLIYTILTLNIIIASLGITFSTMSYVAFEYLSVKRKTSWLYITEC